MTKPFIPVFEANLEPSALLPVLDAAEGWDKRAEHWGADHKTEKRQWPHPACSSYAAYNALCAFARLHGHGAEVMYDIDPMEVHRLAMEIDGLEGGDAETMTTLQAAMEAAATLANQTAHKHWVVWTRVPVDLIGAWQSVVSPVAVGLKIWREWLRYSFIWKTLLWPHDHAELKFLHAVALVGWQPKKRISLRKTVQAFEVHDSSGEKKWIEAFAMARSLIRQDAFGFIHQRDVIALRGKQEPEGFR